MKAGDEINANDLNDLTFIPEENWDTGTTSFEWNATDGSNYADQAAKVTISVNAINDPPEVFDFTKTGNEDQTINFAASDFSSLSAYLDVEDDPLASVRILSLPADGTLKLGSNNVTANQVIDAANLDNLKFIPDGDWSGTTSFEWNGSDGSLYADESAMVNITITASNDPPQIDLNGPAGGTGYTTLFNSNAGPTVITSSNMTLSDPDGNMLDAVYVKIDNVKDGAAEVLDAAKSGTDIKISYNKSKATLTLQGPDTIANFLKVLKTVTYDNTSTTPDPTQRSVRFEAYDGQAFSNSAFTEVDIVRPAITLSIDEPFQTVTSGGTAIFTINHC
ncbi:MAG: Ig-like domain-containing protein [Chloroflexota bacterium]